MRCSGDYVATRGAANGAPDCPNRLETASGVVVFISVLGNLNQYWACSGCCWHGRASPERA
eukprot:7667955-Alexandrium_andersonii.AAC.1